MPSSVRNCFSQPSVSASRRNEIPKRENEQTLLNKEQGFVFSFNKRVERGKCTCQITSIIRQKIPRFIVGQNNEQKQKPTIPRGNKQTGNNTLIIRSYLPLNHLPTNFFCASRNSGFNNPLPIEPCVTTIGSTPTFIPFLYAWKQMSMS